MNNSSVEADQLQTPPVAFFVAGSPNDVVISRFPFNTIHRERIPRSVDLFQYEQAIGGFNNKRILFR